MPRIVGYPQRWATITVSGAAFSNQLEDLSPYTSSPATPALRKHRPSQGVAAGTVFGSQISSATVACTHTEAQQRVKSPCSLS
mmetsp:Transcript_17335/g.30932  ORF Transcript_17335/g.30932 Transcript_17335/m.30932 type:complete len:83 (+) Transcript_17335:614-862(+)